MFLALREIRHEPVRFGLIVAVVTLVAYLTFFIASLAVGLAHLYRAGIDGWDSGSVVITDASNENVSASRFTQDQVTAAQDLASAHGSRSSTLVSTAAVARAPGVTGNDGKDVRVDVFAFGIDLDSDLLPPITEGRAITDPSTEVLVDDTVRSKGLSLGDSIELIGSDHPWTVVGFTHDTTFQAAPTITVDDASLREYGPSSLSPAVSAVVLDTDLSEDDDAVAAAQEAGLTVLNTEALIRTLPGYSAQVLTFSLMIASLVLIAATVLGIFSYVLTLQKRPVIGILKARGVPTAYLVRSGCAQTTVLAAAGVVLGLALTLLTSLVLPDAVPFRMYPILDLGVVAAFVLVSVLGSLIAVRVVARIDPVEAIA